MPPGGKGDTSEILSRKHLLFVLVFICKRHDLAIQIGSCAPHIQTCFRVVPGNLDLHHPTQIFPDSSTVVLQQIISILMHLIK